MDNILDMKLPFLLNGIQTVAYSNKLSLHIQCVWVALGLASMGLGSHGLRQASTLMGLSWPLLRRAWVRLGSHGPGMVSALMDPLQNICII